MNEDSRLINISKKGFLSVVIILTGLIIVAGILTYVIPAGTFQRDGNLIISGTFEFSTISDGYPIWRWLLAPIEVLGSDDGLSIIMISLFLLILGGTFTLMEKTGGIHVILKRLINRFKDRKYVLLRIVVLAFMLFGAFFGIFEESVALMPIMIILSLSLGWDTLTGIGMTVLAAGFGFASGITNPFTVGVASDIAGINILSGVGYRLIVFVLMYVLLSSFLVYHAKKIEKDPTKSLTFEDDQKKARNFDVNGTIAFKNETTIFRAYVTMFIVLLFFIIGISIIDLVSNISLPTIPFMALTFLIGGLTAGYLVTKDFRFTLKKFGAGMLSVAPAVLLIMMAASVKYIIVQGNVMDTILYYLADALSGQTPVVGILLIYGLVLFVEFFIGSGSAKAYLIIPLLIPLVALVGYSSELAILAFIFGDGYTNMLYPTNGVLLIGLSMAGINYGKWFKWTWVLQLITLLLTIVFLLVGLWIGY
ncbi:MAG: AbgT family transporter [Candidatus Izemoplasmatales bacterium]|nr:AbgT family transporter [Candidatus Izemoplasmatales bacterium]MDD4596168.1 AbgT family transporter [Candidatus Izemoplasmatales bacterium]